MKDNFSPEEKLLRLIRSQKKEVPLEAKPKVKSAEINFSGQFKFPSLGKIIFTAFILSAIYLAVSLIYPWFSAKEINLTPFREEAASAAKIETAAQREEKPYEFYLEGIKGRDIFNYPAISEESAPAQAALDRDVTKDISLLGVILGENPQAVLEDKKTQKTYYLNKGQFLGELEVGDIQEGKIILNFKGQKYELYL